jgi:hypothetical protein
MINGGGEKVAAEQYAVHILCDAHEMLAHFSLFNFDFFFNKRNICCLTLSPPAVKTRCLSQCQAFQRLVRSSHTLVNWMLNNCWSTESIFNQFSVILKTLNALCACLQYKHTRSIIRVIRSDKPITSVFPVKSQKCDSGAEPTCRLFATSAGKGLNNQEWGVLTVAYAGVCGVELSHWRLKNC